MVIHINGYEIALEELGNRYLCYLRRHNESRWMKSTLTIPAIMPMDEARDAFMAWTDEAEMVRSSVDG